MSSSSQLLETSHSAEHLVQLYGDDHGALARNVSGFLSEGWRLGEGLLVIATRLYRELLSKQLRKDGIDPIEAVREGRLVWLPAEAVLAGIVVEGQVSPDRFGQFVGGAVRALRAHPGTTGIRVFGELVGLLWRAGQAAAAIQLEELWCGLIADEPLKLFCAYPIDVLGSEFEESQVGPLLHAHTRLVSSFPYLDRALDQAASDVLGSARDRAAPVLDRSPVSGRAVLPPGEAAVLRLRANLDGSASKILERARLLARGTPKRRRSSNADGLSTGDAAKLLGTTTRTLLFYEEEGLVRPNRTPRGSRLYSRFDLLRAAMAMRLSRLGFPLRLVKQLASIRQAAWTGHEASAKLTALFESLQLEIEGRVSELQALAGEVGHALALVHQCKSCPRPPTAAGCPECPCQLNFDRSGLLQLALAPDRPSTAKGRLLTRRPS